MVRIPAILEGQPYHSLDVRAIDGIGGEPLAALTQTPLLKTHALLRAAPEKLLALQRTPAREVLGALAEAGALLRRDEWRFGSFSRPAYVAAVAASTGLPAETVAAEIGEMADLLERMEEITRVQLPASEEHPLDAHRYVVRGKEVGYFPAGRSLLVKLPGNVPTICVYWLVPLALKRPVILVPPEEDPFTHLVLVEAIRAVAPWLAACVQFLPCEEAVWSRMLDSVDQLILPQSLAKRARTEKTHLIHYGRSKLLVRGEWDDAAVDVAARRMLWNHGRTCTGLTSVITVRRGRAFAERVAERLRGDPGPLALFHPERARQLDAAIETFVQAGEVEEVTGRPRLREEGGRAMLMPTVLWVKQPRSRAFGLELPFPFITVAEAEDEARMLELSRDALILSVLGGEPELLQRLCCEPSIHKVFAGAHAERGYDPLDPHEGYLADFLYRKKAVLLS